MNQHRNGQRGLVHRAGVGAIGVGGQDAQRREQVGHACACLVGMAKATVRAGLREQTGSPAGLIAVNSSRAILYASAGDDFTAAARSVAQRTRDELEAACA